MPILHNIYVKIGTPATFRYAADTDQTPLMSRDLAPKSCTRTRHGARTCFQCDQELSVPFKMGSGLVRNRTVGAQERHVRPIR